MKNLYISVVLLVSVSLLSSGCAASKQGKWLDGHAQRLSQAANSNMPPEKKLDVLAQSYVDMMHQSLNFVNPKKGVNYAKAYSKANGANIEKIITSLGEWKGDMGALEIIAFGINMTQKPYMKDMVNLFPRFRRKYKTYSTIWSLSNKVRKGVIGLGGKKLEGLLGK